MSLLVRTYTLSGVVLTALRGGSQMRIACYALALSAMMLIGGPAVAQGTYPVADKVADKVIAKYQSSSCDQLKAQKQNPPSGRQAEMEQRVVQQLKSDPQMREYFINKVAAPIANKLFDCGIIP